MAVFIFPLEMPWDYNLFQNSANKLLAPRVRSITFEAEGQEAFAPEAGGRFVSVHLGPQLWRMQLATPVLTEEEFSLWRTWFDVLEGSKNEFRGYDVRRPMPWNYRNGYAGLVRAGGSVAFLGDSSVASINAAREEITNNTGTNLALPVGFQFEVGDYCELMWNNPSNPSENLFSLHRIVRKPAAANGSGVTTIHVRPRVHPDIPASGTSMTFGEATVFEPRKRAACLMRVTRRDRSAEAKTRTISFEAVQSLRFE